ncbi:MAG: arsenate reductase ArsC [Candidatus Krumholzibacteriota bacterium]|nr:arsenate reductase ArsC [Candidatus Krumholzibacteriota bacterium]
MSNNKVKILFVCIGNMCRSPMAEGFARELGGDAVDVYSAGTHPTGVVSGDSIMMMDEINIDISRQSSNGFDDVPMDEMDIVVSMARVPAAELVSPGFAGAVHDWEVADPIGGSPDYFRSVRDDIRDRVRTLLAGIDTTK